MQQDEGAARIGAWIRQARGRLTQKEIALRGGPSEATQRRIEGGTSGQLRDETLRKYAQALGVTVETLRDVEDGHDVPLPDRRPRPAAVGGPESNGDAQGLRLEVNELRERVAVIERQMGDLLDHLRAQ